MADAILAGTPATYPERVNEIFGRPAGLLARLGRFVPESVVITAARFACTRPRLRRRLVLEGAFGMGG